jgi:hypothetical protein
MLRELQLEILEGLLDEGRAPVAIERLSEERPLTPAQQLTIYRRSVASTLAATLAEVYPVCRRLVGERFFGAAAAAYVRVARSRSPDLNEYGDGFGSFLAGFAPAASLPYLPDVARLEWAWHRAFHAPDDGAIDMDVLASSVASADPERVVFRLPRSATLLDSPYPIDRIWQVNQSDHRGDETVDLSSGGVRLLVRRHGLAPCMESLSEPESHFLRAVAEGLDLGDICLGLSQEHPGTDEGRLLAAAITRGWVSGFECR